MAGKSAEEAKTTPKFNRALNRLRKRVRELRQMHGLTYVDLQHRSDVSWRLIMALENGEPSNPTLLTIVRLADALGVATHELLMPAQSGVRRKKKAAKPAAKVVPISKAKKAPR